MKPIMRRGFVRALMIAAALVPVAAAAGGLWIRAQLRSSLPQVDGERRVTRDALGIPTIRGTSRDDADVVRCVTRMRHPPAGEGSSGVVSDRL
jgi:hypothetical protein